MPDRATLFLDPHQNNYNQQNQTGHIFKTRMLAVSASHNYKLLMGKTREKAAQILSGWKFYRNSVQREIGTGRYFESWINKNEQAVLNLTYTAKGKLTHYRKSPVSKK